MAAGDFDFHFEQFTVLLGLLGELLLQFLQTLFVSAQPFHHRHLYFFEPADERGKFGGGFLLRGEKLAPLRGKFLNDGVFERFGKMWCKRGLHGIQK